NIEYGVSGFAQGTATVINDVTNPITITDLQPNTNYDFYVQDSCSATMVSSWSGPGSFTTCNVFISDLTDEICDNDSILFQGTWLYTAGIYSDTVVAFDGCNDSIYNLDLTVLPTYDETIEDSICDGDSYILGSQTLTTAGTYTEVFSSSLGCDSTVTLNLYVNPVYSETDEDTICDGDVYDFGTQSLSAAGTYTETFTSITGCDSVVTLTLHVNPVYNETLNATICEGESYDLGSQNLTETGTYTEVFSSVTGCDSTVVLNLTVNAQDYVSTQVEICDNDSILIYGEYISTAGVYMDTTTNVAGCDSILEIEVIVHPTYEVDDYIEICNGDSAYLANEWQTISGTYIDTIPSLFGCDSIVSTVLNVTNEIINDVDFSICSGDSIFAEDTWQTTQGVYHDTTQSVFGCDSIIITNLMVYDNPMVNLGEDATLCANYDENITLDAGPADEYIWSDISSDQTLYLDSIVTGGLGTFTYSVTATNGGLCSAADTINITFEICSGIHDDLTNSNVKIYPNPTKDIFYIEGSNMNSDISIECIDITGKIIQIEEVHKSEFIRTIDLGNAAQGVYFIKITSGDTIKTERIIKK
ncbi:MAG: hypothetical protein C0594_03050, partial [Marinilabiliales bacterium]